MTDLTPETIAKIQERNPALGYGTASLDGRPANVTVSELRALLRAAERGMTSLGSFRESVQSAVDRERYRAALERVQAVVYPAPPSDLAYKVRAITEPALGWNAPSSEEDTHG